MRHGQHGRAAGVAGRIAMAIALAAASVTGCGGGATPEPAAPAARQKAPPKASAAESALDAALAEANRTMAAGVPMGPSAAPVDVRFDLPAVPAAATPFDLNVAVLPTAAAPSLRVEVIGSDGLVILDPASPVTFQKVQAGAVVRVPVKASATEAGSRVVVIKVILDLPAGAEERGFAFPVIVGGGAAHAPPAGPSAP